jgi:hypothetical protein
MIWNRILPGIYISNNNYRVVHVPGVGADIWRVYAPDGKFVRTRVYGSKQAKKLAEKHAKGKLR